MANAFRRYWPVDALAVIVLIVVFLFGSYLTGRQHVADSRQQQAITRAERQRQAICAILANIPGHIPPEIARARAVFARPGHPRDCQPIVHRHSRPAVPVVPSPAPTRTVVVLVTPRTASPAPSPTATRTPHPRPTPTSRPSPSPTPTCVLFICP